MTQIANVSTDSHRRASGRLVSLASLGGAAGERLQALVEAALAWVEAEQAVMTAQLVAPLATGTGVRPDRIVRTAELKERDARRAFDQIARDVAKWSEAVSP